MKILIVCVHRPDQAPAQRFRFEQYLEFLSQNGVECTYSNLLKESDYRFFYKKGNFLKKISIVSRSFFKRYRELRKISEYDIVFIQREAIMLGTSFFERQYAKNSKIIFDYDDAIWLEQISGPNKIFRFSARSRSPVGSVPLRSLPLPVRTGKPRPPLSSVRSTAKPAFRTW